MSDKISPLAYAISQCQVLEVAELLDRKASIGEPELMALVKLAWSHRGDKEEPEAIEAAEAAQQVYTMIAQSGGDLKLMTNRGRIVDRISAVQPDWPNREDLATGLPLREMVEGFTAAEALESSEASPTRVSRGAMHRRPR